MLTFKIKKILMVGFAAIFLTGGAHAVDRNSTGTFSWGDDLSESGGEAQLSDPTAPKQFKSNHLPDIKTAIDLSLTACDITSDVYLQTDREAISQIGYPGKLVSSTHVNNLRRAIEALYDARNDNTVGDYFTGDVSPATPILKKHIHDMRNALDHLAQACPPPGAAVCGNDIIESGEECDNGASNGACPVYCSATCTVNNVCCCADGCEIITPTGTCSDGIQNQGELGIDCGGPCLNSCPIAKGPGLCSDVGLPCSVHGLSEGDIGLTVDECGCVNGIDITYQCVNGVLEPYSLPCYRFGGGQWTCVCR